MKTTKQFAKYPKVGESFMGNDMWEYVICYLPVEKSYQLLVYKGSTWQPNGFSNTLEQLCEDNRLIFPTEYYETIQLLEHGDRIRLYTGENTTIHFGCVVELFDGSCWRVITNDNDHQIMTFPKQPTIASLNDYYVKHHAVKVKPY